VAQHERVVVLQGMAADDVASRPSKKARPMDRSTN
jgi:hypothetical protein